MALSRLVMIAKSRTGVRIATLVPTGTFAIRYCSREIYRSARKHGIDDDDIVHAVENALVVADQSDGKALYLGTDRAGNLL